MFRVVTIRDTKLRNNGKKQPLGYAPGDKREEPHCFSSFQILPAWVSHYHMHALVWEKLKTLWDDHSDHLLWQPWPPRGIQGMTATKNSNTVISKNISSIYLAQDRARELVTQHPYTLYIGNTPASHTAHSPSLLLCLLPLSPPD